MVMYMIVLSLGRVYCSVIVMVLRFLLRLLLGPKFDRATHTNKAGFSLLKHDNALLMRGTSASA